MTQVIRDGNLDRDVDAWEERLVLACGTKFFRMVFAVGPKRNFMTVLEEENRERRSPAARS